MSMQSFTQGSRPSKHEDTFQSRPTYPLSSSPAAGTPYHASNAENINEGSSSSMSFAHRPAWESHASDPLPQRHAGYHTQRRMHQPYPSYDARHMSDMGPMYDPHSRQAGPSQNVAFSASSPSASVPVHASSPRLTEFQQRHVSRAACLSCRNAKRKCDGCKPICGPCSLRGVKDGVQHEDGKCIFVASKRGGPRFKGVKGSEATKKKLDERDRIGKIKTPRSVSGGYATEESHSVSPSDPNLQHMSSSHHATPGSSASDVPSHRFEQNAASPQTPDAPLYHSSDPSDVPAAARHFASVVVSDSSSAGFPFKHGRDVLGAAEHFGPVEAVRGALFDGLTSNNLDTFHKLQNSQSNYSLSLANFYQKLEDLPKAGAFSSSGADDFESFDIDLPQALLDIETATLSSVAINSEQQTRALLSDYYELVYPACPVMLPSGHLSSLAFHLSEDDSSALLSAISACVALHLPQTEVRRIVKGSLFFHDQDDHETKAELLDLEQASRQEIAAYLAKSAEKLLMKKVALLARASSFSTEPAKNIDSHRYATNVKVGGIDLELVRIKLVATHTLLAHYHYGTCNTRRAFHFAMQAWKHAQTLNLDSEESLAPVPSWFSQEQKCEWARRAYWVSYTAATVMSCTGGFKPLVLTRDMPSDLGLLPNLKGDRSSWKVLVRGAQFVSRAYASLYDLDSCKNRSTRQNTSESGPQTRKWEAIFESMQKVDSDVMQYARNDAAWSDESCFTPSVGLSRRVALFEEENETRLNRSLRVAGKLMTSGALIILHRAQAFANAKIFVAPTCGIPGACDDNSDTASDLGARNRYPSDRLWHRDAETKSASGKNFLGTDIVSPSDEIGSSRGGDTEDTAARSQSRGSIGSSSSGSGGGGGSLSKSTQGCSPSMSLSRRVAVAPYGIPVRYNGGPFDPSDSLDRCRFAASVMYSQLEHINASTFQHGRRESMAVLPVEGAVTNENQASARETWSAPSLPPFSACSLVLAAYVLLMETLHAQIAAGTPGPVKDMELDSTQCDDDLSALLSIDPRRSIPNVQPTGPKAQQLAVKLQDCIIDIEATLNRFSRAWDIAKGYAQEVKLLLDVNQSLFADSA